MNHYCTYFDRGFLVQGVALWRSVARHDPDAALWVLALDDETADALRALGDTFLRVVPLAELEAADPRTAFLARVPVHTLSLLGKVDSRHPALHPPGHLSRRGSGLLQPAHRHVRGDGSRQRKRHGHRPSLSFVA
jgi:hypothetical protein